MRSLWRILALQWLGGEGSEALTGDSTVLESLMFGEPPRVMHAFDVRRAPEVSHHAMMSPGRRVQVGSRNRFGRGFAFGVAGPLSLLIDSTRARLLPRDARP